MPYFKIDQERFSLFCELKDDQRLIFDILERGIYEFHYMATFTNDTYPPQIKPFLPTLQICYNYLKENLQKFFFFNKENFSINIEMEILGRKIIHQIVFQKVQNEQLEKLLIEDREKQLVLKQKPTSKNANILIKIEKVIKTLILLSFFACIWLLIIYDQKQKTQNNQNEITYLNQSNQI